MVTAKEELSQLIACVEFPVIIHIMLDRTAPKFLKFECLAFLVGCFTRALIKTAQCGDVVGWE